MMSPGAYAFGPSPYGDPGTGVGFVDGDGRPMNVGYAKPNWAGSPVAVTTMTPSDQGQDKGAEGQAQTYFPPPPGAGASQPRNEGS